MESSASKNYVSQLFKSDQRGVVNKAGYKCLSTFNFGDYNEESRQPFGALQFVNDISLAPGNAVLFNRSETIQDVILPLSGSFSYRHFPNKKEQVRPEHMLFLEPGTDHACEIQNAYETEWINYLHLGIKKEATANQLQTLVHAVNFASKDVFVPLQFEQVMANTAGVTAAFSGHSKSIYTMKQQGNGVFVYVINGGFEVEGRLMEFRDGLTLWNTPKLHVEALSEDAILLLLEIPIT